MPIEATEFKRALGQVASGVTVVTTRDAAGTPLGLTVSAFCSLSLAPPLVLVSIDQRSETLRGLDQSGLFAVSVLAEGLEAVSHRFAFAPEKFDEGLEQGQHGLPLVQGALAHIECRVAGRHPGGDHVIYVGEVLRLAVHPGRPLLYHAGRYARLLAQEEPE